MVANTSYNPFEEAQNSIQNESPFDVAEQDIKKENHREAEGDFDSEIERHLARMTFTGLSALGSLPGEVREFAKSIHGQGINELNLLGKKIGLPELKEPEFGGMSQAVKDKWDPVLNALDIFPTYEQIKKYGEEKSAGYLSPKDESEKAFDETIRDVVNINFPMTRGANPLIKTGIAIGANLAKQGSLLLGMDEDKADLLKMGTWTIGSLAGNMNARQFGIDQTRIGRQGIGNNAFNPHALEQDLDILQRGLLRGDPRSDPALKAIRDIRHQMRQGQTNVQDLIERYDALNAMKREKGMFEFGRVDRRVAERRLTRVQHAIRDQIEQHSADPHAFQQWRNGLEALAVVSQTENMTRWVDNLLSKGKYKDLANKAVYGLFTGGAGAAGTATALGFGSKLLIGAPLAAGLAGAYKGIQVLQRVVQSPVLANYYRNAMQAIVRQDAPAFISNYNKLNKSYENQKPAPYKND